MRGKPNRGKNPERHTVSSYCGVVHFLCHAPKDAKQFHHLRIGDWELDL
jgi:hypothetical protein